MKKEKRNKPMTLKDLKSIYSSGQCSKRKVTITIMKSKAFQDELNRFTSFLNKFEDVSLQERIWYFINDKHSPEICPFCNKNRKRFYSSRNDNHDVDWSFDIIDYTEGNYIGTVNGSIYFRFDPESSAYIQGEGKNILPAGNYAADVTFEIRTVE